MEDLKSFSKSQGALEADKLDHWDIGFWSERLRESKYEINEVDSLSPLSMPHFLLTLIHFRLVTLYCLDYLQVVCHHVWVHNQISSDTSVHGHTYLFTTLNSTGRTSAIFLIAKSYGWPFQSCEDTFWNRYRTG